MDKLSCDIHPRKMIKMVMHVSRDHIIISNKYHPQKKVYLFTIRYVKYYLNILI